MTSTPSKAPPVQLDGLELVEAVGSGPRSAVWRARRSGRDLAVKLLAEGQSPASAEAFLRSAAEAACARHPGLPQVEYVGLAGSTPVLVSEWVAGETLRAQVAAESPTPIRVVEIARALAEQLTLLHTCQVVHGDIRPENVLIDPAGGVHLVDIQLGFGADRNDDPVASPYRAPETRGDDADGRADLYAVGAVLFYCLAGRPLSALDTQPLEALPDDKLREKVLGRVVLRLLDPEPARRYQSAHGLLDDLQGFSQLARRLIRGSIVQLGAQDARAARVDPPLFGRADALERLVLEWQEVLEGKGRVVVLEGPPGAGRSRLARELVREAERDGAVVLCASCDPLDPVPLSPIRRAFEEHALGVSRLPPEEREVHVARLQAAARQHESLLAPLSPALATMLEARVSTSGQSAGSEMLLEVTAGFVRTLARAGPAVLLIDDIEWSDDATQRVWEVLAAIVRESHLLVVATAEDNGSAQAWRTRLEPGLSWVETVGELETPALAALVSGHLGGGPVDPEFVEKVRSISQGYPLAAESIVEVLLTSGVLRPSWGTWRLDAERLKGIEVTSDLGALVRLRVAAMGERTRTVLTAAAVLGNCFDPGPLRAMTNLDRERIHDVLAAAERAGFVARSLRGDFCFVHPSFRVSLLDQLTDQDRGALHAKAAAALEPRKDRSVEHLCTLAAHHAAASSEQSSERQYETSLQAALVALKSNAMEVAHQLLLIATEAAKRTGGAADERIAAGLDVTSAQTGRFREATQRLEDRLGHSTEPLERAQLRGNLAELSLCGWADTDRAQEHIAAGLRELGVPWPTSPFRRGLDALAHLIGAGWARLTRASAPNPKATAPRQLQARLYALSQRVATFDADWARLRDVGARQLALAPRGPDGWFSLGLFFASWKLASVAGMLSQWALDRTREMGDARGAATAQLQAGYVALLLGQGEVATARIQHALVYHGPFLQTVDYLSGTNALVWNLLLRGRASEARGWVERAERRAANGSAAVDAQHPVFLARPILDPMLGETSAPPSEDESPTQRARTAEATALQRLGTAIFTGQVAEMDAAITEWEQQIPNPTASRPLHAVGLVFRAHCRRLQAYAAPQQAQRVTQLREALDALGRDARTELPLAHHALLTADLSLLNRDHAAAKPHLNEALRLAEICDAPWVSLWALRGATAVHRALGDQAAATVSDDLARQLAQELGGNLDLPVVEVSPAGS